MYTISKTEAVNRIMQAVDGSIISDIDQSQSDTVLQAIRAIDLATDKIQIENEWNFNYDGPRTLTANEGGEMEVPTDYLYIKFQSWSNGSVWHLTVKDGKVWNRRDGTHEIEGTVDIGGSRKFEYDECPGSIQNLIVEKAKYHFLGSGVHMSSPRLALAQADLKEAYMAAQKWDAQQQFGLMDVNPGIREHFRRRGSTRGWWWGN